MSEIRRRNAALKGAAARFSPFKRGCQHAPAGKGASFPAAGGYVPAVFIAHHLRRVAFQPRGRQRAVSAAALIAAEIKRIFAAKNKRVAVI